MINSLLCATLFGVSNAQSGLTNGTTGTDIDDPVVTPHISIKVDRAFIGHFKNASNLRWYEIDGKYLIKFTMNDQENRALITRTGELVYHISTGTELNLPADVRKLIRSTYYDQKITSVYKVTQREKTVWIANLEDDKNCIAVRVEDYEIDEIQWFTKSN